MALLRHPEEGTSHPDAGPHMQCGDFWLVWDKGVTSYKPLQPTSGSATHR